MTPLQGAVAVEELRQKRSALLACEAIGWLHMVGKAHPDFLRAHGATGVSYKPEQWHRTLTPDWCRRLDWVRAVRASLSWPNPLTHFLMQYEAQQPQPNLVGLLQAAHAMASGIEKNQPPSPSGYLGQDVTHMWLTSPFGHPVRNLMADPPPVLRPEGWDSLVRGVGGLLDDLRSLGTTTTTDVDRWWSWREGVAGMHGWLRHVLSSTVAETRLPNNDVTLWDQSYVAAALFKAAAAGVLLAGASNWTDLKMKTRWRVLSVGLGVGHYEARAVRIGDWVGARRDIDAFFARVRRLIEVDLALGGLVYQDDESMVFTFPGLRADAAPHDAKGSLDDDSAQALTAEIGGQIDEYARERNLETPPLCRLSALSTRSFIGMVKELRHVRDDLAVPLHRSWQVAGPAESSGHVCPVCRVRFNGASQPPLTDNANKDRVCRVCGERRRGRLDTWLSGKGDTIWISEVADDNDRLALLTLSFEVDAWLTGDYLESLRAQSIADWRRFNPVVGANKGAVGNPVDPSKPQAGLVSYVRGKLGSFDSSDPVLGGLQAGYRPEHDWNSFFSKIVEDRADAPDYTSLDDDLRARWIVHQLFCKLPSPGRLHRFWRAAETFFDELLVLFREVSSVHANRWRTRRLALTPDEASRDQGWEDGETYQGRFRGEPLDLLHRQAQGDFLTIANLARCLDAPDRDHAFVQASQANPVDVRGDDGRTRRLVLASAGPAESIGAYAPIIPLDRDPNRFRVLVPLDRASACIEATVAKWRDELGRVWDRMPLRIGVVGFSRMTPFHAVVEATRNVEDRLAGVGGETWRVLGTATRNGVTALTFDHPNDSKDAVLVPTALPDGRDDAFYPYVRLEDRVVRYPRDFQHPDGQVYRHVLDLRVGDGVKVDPGLVARVFLDTTARRFEPVNVHPLADFHRMRNTWALLAQTAPSLTALRGVWAELAERGAAWRDADGQWLPEGPAQWAELARVLLGERLAVSGAALDTLVDAAVSGLLGWAIEWHLTWLKESLER